MIVVVALVSLVVGVLLAAVVGNPLVIIVALIAGAIVANRIGSRHQAAAIRSSFDRSPRVAVSAAATLMAPPAPSVEQRLAELERLHEAGVITDEQYDSRRAEL